jgi:glutamate dehydrogenase (NAD(P)+)
VFFGDIDGSAEQSFAKIADRMKTLSDNMFDYAEANGVTPREAALAVAAQRLALIDERF